MIEDTIKEIEVPIETSEEEKDKDVPETMLDARQKLMWDYYINPKSKTFGNATGSARRAGYSPSYSLNISNHAWWKAKKRKMNLLGKAVRALDKVLDMATKNDEGFEQADLVRVQVDAAKFVAKTLGKDDGFSERTELTGADGAPIVFMPTELMNKYNLAKTNDGLPEGSQSTEQ